jgi:hypothetical protein
MMAMAVTEVMAGDQAGEDTAEAMEGEDTAGEVSLYRANLLFSLLES